MMSKTPPTRVGHCPRTALSGQRSPGVRVLGMFVCPLGAMPGGPQAGAGCGGLEEVVYSGL